VVKRDKTDEKQKYPGFVPSPGKEFKVKKYIDDCEQE
jgi:hypothetical protein